jgi:hypothetical protein
MNYEILTRLLEIDRIMTGHKIPSFYDRKVQGEFHVQAYGPDDPFTLTWGYIPDCIALQGEPGQRELLAIMFAFPGQSALNIDYDVTGWYLSFTLIGPVEDGLLDLLGDLVRPVCMKHDISCLQLANRPRLSIGSDEEAYELIKQFALARKKMQEQTQGKEG